MSHINEILGSTQLSLIWICAIAAVMVFVAIMYSTATFRHESSSLSARFRAGREVIWAIVPIAIVIAAALPAMTMVAPVRVNQSLVSDQVGCVIGSASDSRMLSPAACAKHR